MAPHTISHPRLDAAGEFLDLLTEAAGSAATKLVVALKRPSERGRAITPGIDTPLWNALAVACLPHLRKRGAKIRLARLLAVPRQRIHDYFIARTRVPDAERVLAILLWLAETRAGKTPS